VHREWKGGIVRDPNIVIKTTLVTEKGTELTEKHNKYLFEVDRRSNKIEIRNAVQKLFNVKVEAVNIINQRGKMKRVRRVAGMTSAIKKAIVTLKKGDKIEIK